MEAHNFDLISSDDVGKLLLLASELINNGEVAAGRKMCLNLLQVFTDSQAINCALAFSFIVTDEFSQAESILAHWVDVEGAAFDETLSMMVLSKTLQKDKEGALKYAARVNKESSAYNLVSLLLKKFDESA